MRIHHLNCGCLCPIGGSLFDGFSRGLKASIVCHCLLVETSEGWLLHAGDAYFYRHEMNTPKPHCTPGLRAYQWLMEVDRKTRLRNQERLRELSLSHSDDVRLFCSHDAIEFKTFAQQNKSQLQESFSDI